MIQTFSTPLESKSGKHRSQLAEALHQVRRMVQTCIQCGTCTGSCPNAFAMDLTPRAMWRLVLMDCATELFASKTFMLCSACYQCRLRCPRGLPLTEAMAALKQIANRYHFAQHKASLLFYREFLENIRRNGRIRELALMQRYFMGLKNPVTPLKFSSLGIRLLAKGKLTPTRSEPGKRSQLEPLFQKVAQMEDR